MGAISDHRKKTESPTPGSAHLNFTMATITGFGGLARYMSRNYLPVLVMGSAFAGMYGSSGWLIKEGQHREGHGLASFASLALTAGSIPRIMKGQKGYVVMGLLGAGVGVYNGKKFMDWTDTEEE